MADKVIGASLAGAIDLGDPLLVTSDRISSDLVIKTIRAGVQPSATSRFITSLSTDLAVKEGITNAARLIQNKLLMIGIPNRVVE